jgi:hypothetical protein
MSRVGREGSEESILVKKNLRGKLIYNKDVLQISPDKYLLSEETIIN